MKTIYISTVHSFGAIIRTQVPTSDTSTNISKQNPKQMLVLVVRIICTRGMHPKDIFNKQCGDCIRSSSTSVKKVIPKIPEAWCKKSFKNRSSHILNTDLKVFFQEVETSKMYDYVFEHLRLIPRQKIGITSRLTFTYGIFIWFASSCRYRIYFLMVLNSVTFELAGGRKVSTIFFNCTSFFIFSWRFQPSKIGMAWLELICLRRKIQKKKDLSFDQQKRSWCLNPPEIFCDFFSARFMVYFL